MREHAADEDLDPVVEAYKPGIDVTLIERNLRLTPEGAPPATHGAAQRFAGELRWAGDSARRAG